MEKRVVLSLLKKFRIVFWLGLVVVIAQVFACDSLLELITETGACSYDIPGERACFSYSDPYECAELENSSFYEGETCSEIGN